MPRHNSKLNRCNSRGYLVIERSGHRIGQRHISNTGGRCNRRISIRDLYHSRRLLYNSIKYSQYRGYTDTGDNDRMCGWYHHPQ